MHIMNFSHFIHSCIMLVLAKSKLPEGNFAKDYCNISEVCSDFFKFVHDHTLSKLRYTYMHPYLFYNPQQKRKIDIMFDNFSFFLEYALKNIHIYNMDTLCNGLDTQIKKFINEYEYLIIFNLNINDYCEILDNIYPSFEEVIEFIELSKIICNYKNDVLLNSNFVDLKQMKNNLHSKRVAGHRQDFEKHLFNKGLNKSKRERFVLKERKNKKSRDFRI